jgi:hypothetical protein
MMKRNVGRPPVVPNGGKSSLTMKVPSEFKQIVLDQAAAYGMTITEYIMTLVERDAS